MKTLIKNLKAGDSIRFSLIGKPEWNINCNTAEAAIIKIEDNYILFDNGYCLNIFSDNFSGLYNKVGELQLIKN